MLLQQLINKAIRNFDFVADVTGGSNEDAIYKLISNDKMVAAVEAKQAAKLPFRSVSAPDLAIFGFASLVTKSPLEK